MLRKQFRNTTDHFIFTNFTANRTAICFAELAADEGVIGFRGGPVQYKAPTANELGIVCGCVGVVRINIK